MYCSEQCMIEHQQKTHLLRCPEDEENVPLNYSLRMLDEMRYIFDGMEAMKEYFEEHKEKKTIFDFDMRNPENRRKNLLVALFRQDITYRERLRENLLRLHGELKSEFKSSERNPFLKELLTKLPNIQGNLRDLIFTTNMDLTYDGIGDGTTNMIFQFIHPYEHLLEHSRTPALDQQFFDGKLVWKVIRPLSAGQNLSFDHQI